MSANTGNRTTFVAIILLIQVIILAADQTVPISKEGVECRSSGDDNSGTSFRSRAIRHVRGRLGNHLWGYKLALGLRLHFPEIDWFIGDDTTKYLGRYFKQLSIPNVKTLCGETEFYEEFKAYLEKRVVQWYGEKVGHEVEFPRDPADGRLVVPPELAAVWRVNTYEIIDNPDFLPNFNPHFKEECAGGWEIFNEDIDRLGAAEWQKNRQMIIHPAGLKGDINSKLYIPEVEALFFRDVQFRDEFVLRAQEILGKVKADYLDRLKKKKKGKMSKKAKKRSELEPVFVGVHSRRTDHIVFERDHGDVPVTYSYYIEAMAKYRKHFIDRNVIFVYVSDDMQWGRDKLGSRDKKGDIFFAGDGDVDDPDVIGNDLCLLAQCNHTVTSHGSFSYFAGAFAGGFKIVPEHFREFRSEKTAKSRTFDGDPFENPLERMHHAKL